MTGWIACAVWVVLPLAVLLCGDNLGWWQLPPGWQGW